MFALKIPSRLLSQQKRIMEGERERHNGLRLSVLCMAYSLVKRQRSSMIKTTTGSCLKLPSRLRSVLKLQGDITFHQQFVIFVDSIYPNFHSACLLLQVERVAYTQRARWISRQTQGTWHRYHSATLHCLSDRIFLAETAERQREEAREVGCEYLVL